MDADILNKLRRGCVIPAHPLALTADHEIDVTHQKALTRYYLSAGAGGLAVGVHTTQFAIHDPKIGLYKPVLELAAETAKEHVQTSKASPPAMIAGILGSTQQAVAEARTAKELGYHMGLLSMTALAGKSVDEMIDHARQVADVFPIMGFYLQEAISHMVLGQDFWRKMALIPQLAAIKIAAFDRYRTLDVLQAVAQSGRANEIALYTGNDDTIVKDLLTRYEFNIDGQIVRLRMVGGLLGQWACWTNKAVECLDRISEIHKTESPIHARLMTYADQLTLANKAIFDADNNFTGCIPGILYVLKKQGLVRQIQTLDPREHLSPGQTETIDAIIRNYPHLTDNDYVTENLHTWLSS